MRTKSSLLRWGVLVLAATLLPACGSSETTKDAEQLTGGKVDQGKTKIAYYGCATCHTIPGIRGADALVGPPLKQIASRAYIGGVLNNTPDNMITWLQNPPGVDPKTAMPNLHVSESDARDIASYLYTLR